MPTQRTRCAVLRQAALGTLEIQKENGLAGGQQVRGEGCEAKLERGPVKGLTDFTRITLGSR